MLAEGARNLWAGPALPATGLQKLIDKTYCEALAINLLSNHYRKSTVFKTGFAKEEN